MKHGHFPASHASFRGGVHPALFASQLEVAEAAWTQKFGEALTNWVPWHANIWEMYQLEASVEFL